MKKKITVEFEHSEKKMRFAHEGATITNDDGEEIGSVRPMLDGGSEINIGDEQVHLSGKDLWNAACDFLGKSELKV